MHLVVHAILYSEVEKIKVNNALYEWNLVES